MSIKLTPVRVPVGLCVFGLVIWKVAVDAPFKGILVGRKDFNIWGGDSTLIMSCAGGPVPPSTEVTTLVTLFLIPMIVPVTSTLKLQVLSGI